MDSRPIGFFDSGVGGISVLKHAVKILPKENFIYFGDDKNAPYGEKNDEQIKQLSLKCGEFLFQKGVKVIVMACNTATSVAVKQMRELYKMPVISIEPAVKPAVLECDKTLVMATPATIAQNRYRNLISKLGCADRVVNMPCKGLAELLEPGDFENPELHRYIEEKFKAVNENIDGIVIGCTHYSFITQLISEKAREIFGHECKIFDGMYGMVAQLKTVLQQHDLLSEGPGGKVEFYSSSEQNALDIFKRIYHTT